MKKNMKFEKINERKKKVGEKKKEKEVGHIGGLLVRKLAIVDTNWSCCHPCCCQSERSLLQKDFSNSPTSSQLSYI